VARIRKSDRPGGRSRKCLTGPRACGSASRGLRLDPATEIETIEELAQHVDDRYRDLLARGFTDADAASKLGASSTATNCSRAKSQHPGER
jgi:hypothetical protein